MRASVRALLTVAASLQFVAPQARAEWKVLEEAHEIVDISTVYTQPEQPVLTYKSADDPDSPGDTEIPDDLWTDYVPPSPYVKNTTRNLQFNESEFLASPGASLGTTTYATTSDGYTWGFMSRAINAMWPYNADDYAGLSATSAYYAGNLVTTPAEGVVKVTANFKGQNIKFWANEDGVAPGTPGAVPLDRYFVKDQWGNEYIMHASGQLDQSQVAAAFAAAVLPEGWTKETRQLSEDLILNPARGADGTFHYLVFRDSADNTYHQVAWSDTGSLAAQVAGMPIWGGNDSNMLSGDVGGIQDDVMHGADGDDVLSPGLGNNEVWGDDGFDTVVLPGSHSDYALISSSADLTDVVLGGLGYTQTIRYVEQLQFDDETLSIADFVEQATPDTTPPVLHVAGKSRRVVTKRRVVIRGSVRDASAASVDVKVGSRPYRPADGETHWKFIAHVGPGQTLIRVRATDAAGNRSPVKRIVFLRRAR